MSAGRVTGQIRQPQKIPGYHRHTREDAIRYAVIRRYTTRVSTPRRSIANHKAVPPASVCRDTLRPFDTTDVSHTMSTATRIRHWGWAAVTHDVIRDVIVDTGHYGQ